MGLEDVGLFGGCFMGCDGGSRCELESEVVVSVGIRVV